ncbi:MurR/RpiR family transcriptional regulator [uncultured Pseudacidovorax sp.]|uniref:MurR/RpiR family transcriptional regulator n=1 Tax=uncultured Pseudacidovorax sp. TaxID=679313 RepID=UPI0025FF1B7A|nr:MurR/RpiR family transcriptional regulator [uncultured Pseudacidovorax sp.]
MAELPLLQRMARAREHAPATRRAILDLILADPQRTLEESFEQLAERSASSVPTIMRTCRDLGFAGLREFKLALAQELAVGASPLHRSVSLGDSAQDVVAKIVGSAASTVQGVRAQLDMAVVEATAAAIAAAPHIDIFGAGATSWFMANDLQARLFRLGLSANAWADYHLQQVAAGAHGPGSVVVVFSHVGGMPSLLDSVDVARAQGARTVAITRPGSPLAARADLLLAVDVPEDAVMRVGIDAYLAHLLIIEILSVLVAQQLGDPAVRRLRDVRAALQRQGIDVQGYPLPVWGAAPAAPPAANDAAAPKRIGGDDPDDNDKNRS